MFVLVEIGFPKVISAESPTGASQMTEALDQPAYHAIAAKKVRKDLSAMR